MATNDAPTQESINDALQLWRQGDCTLGDHWFLYRTNCDWPLTEAATTAADDESENVEDLVAGFVVLTQTCDIVRDCKMRPFVEVAALVEVDQDFLHSIKRGRRPQYAYIPGIAAHHLVADLDRVMTVEKSVVATWTKTVGCQTHEESRRFALSLTRKRARTAFPNEFTRFVSPLSVRLSDKHDKDSPEGRALRALLEIRVRAAPDWNADSIELMFWFIRSPDCDDFERIGWHEWSASWLRRVEPNELFTKVEGIVVTLDDLTAQDYLESDILDLDHLSHR